jgi:lysyl-tRNA synthetase class II
MMEFYAAYATTSDLMDFTEAAAARTPRAGHGLGRA